MSKILRVLHTILKIIAAIAAYTFFVIFVLLEIMVQCNLTPEDILNIEVSDSAGKGIAIGIIILLAIIGIPGKKRNMGY